MNRFRLVLPVPSFTFGPLAVACAVGLTTAMPTFSQAVAQNGGGSGGLLSAGGNSIGKIQVRDSKAPFVVRIDEDGKLAPDAVKRLVAAMDANPGRLVALSASGLDLDRGGDAAKQEALAKQLQAVMAQVKKLRPSQPLALRGLPREEQGGSRAKARALNDRFAKVIKSADAIVLTGGVIGASGNGSAAVAKSFPEAMRLAGKRAILYKVDSGWKSRVTSNATGNGGASSSGSPAVGGASDPVLAQSTEIPMSGGSGGEVIAEVLGGWGGSGAGDLNGDGLIDAVDLAIALSMASSGGGSDVPETPVVIQPPESEPVPGSIDGETSEPAGGDDEPVAGGGDDPAEGGGDEPVAGGGDDPPANGGDDPPANGGGMPLDQLFLLNGSGFSGPTAPPANVGQAGDVGFDAKAIARWSTVPFQTFKDTLRVGVVAFHRNGIEKVAFSANGGAWVNATAMTINPSTGISEYWVTLKASDFPDGAVEIRAIAYPKNAGIPRVLGGAYQTALNAAPAMEGEHSMFAWSNFAGTLDRLPQFVSATGDDTSGDGTINSPFKTLSRAAKQIQLQYTTCDNGVIYCLPGEYDFDMKWGSTFAKANDRYITIMPAPGVLRDQVLIEEARPKTARVHLSNVTIKTNDAGNFYTGYNDLRTVLWIDGCAVSAKNGRYGSSQKVLQTCTPYVTESSWNDAPDGPTDAVMVRNTNITKLCSDMVSGVQVVLNVTGGDIDPANTGAHPDIYQIYRPTGSFENHVIYGVRATNFLAQGVFIAALANGEKIRNCAFVNLVLDANQSNFTSQVNRESEHLLIVNCTFDQTFYIRIGDFDDVSFVGNIFKAVTLDLSKCTPAQAATIDWRHNHFVDNTSYGTYTFGADITTGPAPVVNWAMGDFNPLPTGCLVDRVQAVYSNYDAAGSPREPMTAVGALED
ncbi:MAG: hypothetical protein JNL80_09325 [Phycisphaerae bacterium]|nr:hypothetical protein [Phycisphaerae bacterium]